MVGPRFTPGTVIDSAWLNRVDSDIDLRLNLKSFGATGDGVADDTPAIKSWISAAETAYGNGRKPEMIVPPGKYLFKEPLRLPNFSYLSLRGSGRRQSIFLYNGSNRAADLLTVGDGVKEITGLNVGGFGINSLVPMTDGAALRVQFAQRGSEFDDLACGELNPVQGEPYKNLWDGLWFDNVNVVHCSSFDIFVQHDGVVVNGRPGSDIGNGSDLYLDKGTVLGGNIGYHVAGGFGGVYFGETLAMFCYVSYAITNLKVAARNREVIFSSLAVSDANTSSGILINDPLAAGCNCHISAFIGSAGRANSATSPGNNIHIQSFPGSKVTIDSSQIFNATGAGVFVNDPSTFVSIAPTTMINYNEGWGVYSTLSTEKVRCDARMWHNGFDANGARNGAGDVHPNIREWRAFTSTASATVGTLGNGSSVTGSYHRRGSLVSFRLQVVTPSKGTASGAIRAKLPFVVRDSFVCSGRANGVSGKMLQGLTVPETNDLLIMNYDGSFPASDNEVLILSGTVEALFPMSDE